jgi:hypothetical protein
MLIKMPSSVLRELMFYTHTSITVIPSIYIKSFMRSCLDSELFGILPERKEKEEGKETYQG